MSDIKDEVAAKSPAVTAEADKFAAQGEEKRIDDTKAQVIWNGDTCIIVLPCDKINRAFARGILVDADDHIVSKYFEIAQRKPKIVKPGIMGKIGGLIH